MPFWRVGGQMPEIVIESERGWRKASASFCAQKAAKKL